MRLNFDDGTEKNSWGTIYSIRIHQVIISGRVKFRNVYRQEATIQKKQEFIDLLQRNSVSY